MGDGVGERVNSGTCLAEKEMGRKPESYEVWGHNNNNNNNNRNLNVGPFRRWRYVQQVERDGVVIVNL
ncbi:GL16146 [Drosophila persimilis]|uniref:GL16146 n=1 Tax=Drosophila persimilis TaxID=7234 RepID=B4H5H2_DROPE|nr:GL16146 [Drosophila persimilis]